MNRFKIALGRENEFEKIWKERETYLDDVPGFLNFHLIKGEKRELHTVYVSHSTWRSQCDFSNWTKSKEFRSAHKKAGGNKTVYLGHPIFEGFEVVL